MSGVSGVSPHYVPACGLERVPLFGNVRLCTCMSILHIIAIQASVRPKIFVAAGKQLLLYILGWKYLPSIGHVL